MKDIIFPTKTHEEGFEEILDMPELYKKLVPLYELKKFESKEIVGKGEKLKELFHTYIKLPYVLTYVKT